MDRMTDEPNIKNDDRLAGGGAVEELREVLAAMRAASPQCAGFADRVSAAADVLRQRVELLELVRDKLTDRAQSAEDAAAREHLRPEKAAPMYADDNGLPLLMSLDQIAALERQRQDDLASLRQRCEQLERLAEDFAGQAGHWRVKHEQAEADARRYRFLAEPQSIDPYGTHWCDAYNAVGDGRKKKEQIDEDVDTAIRVAALAHDAQDMA